MSKFRGPKTDGEKQQQNGAGDTQLARLALLVGWPGTHRGYTDAAEVGSKARKLLYHESLVNGQIADHKRNSV